MARQQTVSARDFLPGKLTLPALVRSSKSCEGCDLYKPATQTVFGEGPAEARVILVGEQPGDQEDRAGHPFVGPAGKLLDKALAEAGVDRNLVYVTNAVKHFKFEERGKRRIHKKPSTAEVSACRPWLEAEVGVVKPELLVCLGATAALAVAGRDARVQRDRGKVMDHPWAGHVMVTIHPSALLRLPDRSLFDDEFQHFVKDLSLAAAYTK